MKTVLLSFVGQNDPLGRENTEGPILTLLHKFQPNEVILMAVDEKGMEYAKDTLVWIIETFPSLSVEHIHKEFRRGDPVDYEFVLTFAHEVIQKYRNQTWAKEEVVVLANASSGTPQMTTAMILLKTMGFYGDGQAYRVREWKYVDENHPQVAPLRLEFLQEEGLQREFFAALVSGEYVQAQGLLRTMESITLQSMVKSSIPFLQKMVEGLRLWELGQFKKAGLLLAQAQTAMRQQQVFASWLNQIQDQVHWLQNYALQSPHETQENLLELYESILRYRQSQRLTDGLARFWRLVEGVLYFRIAQVYHENPRHLRGKHGGRCDLYDCMDYLKEKQDPQFLQWYQAHLPKKSMETSIAERLIRLRNKRNESLSAHGMQPVEIEEFEEALQIAEILLKTVLVEAWPLHLNYPLDRKQVAQEIQKYWTGMRA